MRLVAACVLVLLAAVPAAAQSHTDAVRGQIAAEHRLRQLADLFNAAAPPRAYGIVDSAVPFDFPCGLATPCKGLHLRGWLAACDGRPRAVDWMVDGRVWASTDSPWGATNYLDDFVPRWDVVNALAGWCSAPLPPWLGFMSALDVTGLAPGAHVAQLRVWHSTGTNFTSPAVPFTR